MERIALEPLIIGRHHIWPPILLAPMAGATDSVLRLLCKRQQAGLVCTELTSSHALYHRNPRSFEFLRWTDEERPVSAQMRSSRSTLGCARGVTTVAISAGFRDS